MNAKLSAVCLAALCVAADSRPGDVVLRIGSGRLRHAGSVEAVLFTPDGKTIISAGSHDSIRLWDAATGEPKGTLPPVMNGATVSLALAPDGKTLAAGNPDCSVSLWDLASRNERRFEGHNGLVRHPAFTADGKTLITPGGDGRDGDGLVRIWDVKVGEGLAAFRADSKWVLGAALSADRRTLATTGQDAVIRLWDVAARAERSQITLKGRVNCLAFAPDGKTIASGEWESVRLWDVRTGGELHRLGTPNSGARALAYSPDGRLLAVAHSSTVTLVDVDGNVVRRLEGHRESVMALAFSPDGRTLATGGQDQAVRVWDVATGRQKLEADEPAGVAVGAQFTPDGRLVTAHKDHWVRVWDATGRLVRRFGRDDFPATLSRLQAVALAPDGKTVVTSYDGNNAIIVWDVATGRELRRFAAPGHMAFALEFTRDGKTLASAGYGNKVILWDPATGKERRRVGDGADTFCSVSFSADGALVAVSGYDRKVRLYEVEDGRERVVLAPPNSGNGDIELSPDGRLLLAILGDRLTLTETASGAALFEYRLAHAAAFRPDGRMLAFVNTNDLLQLHDPLRSPTQVRLEITRRRPRSIAFSPDGGRLITCGEDGVVVVRDAKDGTERPDGTLTEVELGSLWFHLGGPVVEDARRAVVRLTAAPASSVKYLAQRLRPVSKVDAARLAMLVKRLDHEEFDERERAAKELAALGETAEGVLREAAESPSAEVRRRAADLLGRLKEWRYPLEGEALRTVRALEALEHAATPEAKATLRELAEGAPGARLTREAAAAVKRLEGR